MQLWAQRAPGSREVSGGAGYSQPNVLLRSCFAQVFCYLQNIYFPATGPFTQKTEMQENSVLSDLFFFPLFCFSGTLWTLLELPDGAGTCGELGFMTKEGLRNECLDIQLWFSSHGCVSKINSTLTSSMMWGFLSIDCALLGFQPTLWFWTYHQKKGRLLGWRGWQWELHTSVAVLANCLLDDTRAAKLLSTWLTSN